MSLLGVDLPDGLGAFGQLTGVCGADLGVAGAISSAAAAAVGLRKLELRSGNGGGCWCNDWGEADEIRKDRLAGA